MRTKITAIAFASLAALAAASLLGSCDNSFGVLASIQKETKQVGTDVFKNVAVRAVVSDGTRYYAQGAKLHSRAIGATGWSALAVGSLGDYFAAGLVASGSSAGSTLYVAALHPDTLAMDGTAGSGYGVYATTDPAAGWTKLAPTGIDTSTHIVQALYYARGGSGTGRLFAETRRALTATTYAYHLFEWDGVSSWTDRAPSGGYDSALRNVVADATSATFYAATATKVYSGAAGASIGTDMALSLPTSGATIGGLVHDGSLLIVSGSDGSLNAWDGTWHGHVAKSSTPLGPMIRVNVSGGTRLLAAVNLSTSYFGYVEVDTASITASTSASVVAEGKDGIVTRSESLYSTSVYGKPVNAFFFQPSTGGGTLFACVFPGTSGGYGIYASAWDSGAGTWGGWQAQ